MVNSARDGSFKQRRRKGWRTLTSGELMVWLGITLKMGTLGRNRMAHYWSKEDGFGDDKIRSCMTKNRYAEIASMLSFAPRGARGGWNKISWLDDVMRNKCRKACGITQKFVVDESMMKCLSQFCPWIQYMSKKPIKRGDTYVHVTIHTQLFPTTSNTQIVLRKTHHQPCTNHVDVA